MLRARWNKAAKANPALAAALETKINAVRNTADYFKGPEVAALLKGDLTLEAKGFYDHASVMMVAMYAFLDASIEQLDGLLAARIQHLQANLELMFAGVAVVLLVVLYLFAGMLLSVLRSLRSIQGGAKRLAEGDVSKLVDSQSTDELREVGGAVNSVAQTLQKFTKAQLDMARAHNDDGRISHEMRANDFAGAYGDMARNLNAMVKGHIDVQTRFVDLMVEYANGKFDARMAKLPGEQQTISDAAERLRDELLQAQAAAKDTLKIKIALDNASSSLMMADNEGIIRYQNRACIALMQQSEFNFRNFLAQRAAEAAKYIKAVIANSVGKVDEGAKLVQSAGYAMDEIMSQAQRVTAIIGEIAAASKEQSDGVQQVNQTVTQIDQITQQNAALVEEATAAARSLEEQSEALVRAVDIFKFADGREGAGFKTERSQPDGHVNGSAGLRNGKALH